jgi:thiol:disulfide interchange protein
VATALIIAGARPALAQPGGPLDPLAAVNAALGSPIKVEAAVEGGSGDGPPVLVVTALVDEGWHLYAVDQKPGGPRPTRIVVAADSSWLPAGPFVPDEAPHARTITDVPGWVGLEVREHSGRVVWRAPLVPGGGDSTTITGSVSVQLCRDTSCSPPETIPFSVAAPAKAAMPAKADAPAKTEPPDAPTATRAPAGGDGDDPFVAAEARSIAAHVPPRAHAAVEAAFGAVRKANGGAVWPLLLRLSPDAGYHLYEAAGSADSEAGQGKPTVVAVASREAAVRVLRATPSRVAKVAESRGVDGPVVLEIVLPAGEGPDDGTVELIVGFQTCTETSCDPPTAVRLKATLPPAGSGADAGAIEFGAAKYAEAAKKPLPITALAAASAPHGGTPSGEGPAGALPAGPPTDTPGGVIEAARATPATAATGLSLPAALLSGLLGGLILNLMPCVLPVLGLKLMSFAQQSGKKRQEIFRMNLWYCAGVYAVFMALATASVAANLGLGSRNLAWGEQFTSAGFNITMAALVFAFALSFLGVWEIPIPGFIGEKAGHVQGQEGAAGSFLKGVLSTVLATPCSGPFLGPVFGFTLSQPTGVTYAVFAAIATGMALPYIVVGLLPGLARSLPRPGAWMETLKEVLGFVMLGTVVFLFTFLNHVWFVPTFALLVGIWAACWWIGKAQHAGGGVAGFGRWVQGAAVATAIGFAAFSFLGPVTSIIPWEPFSRARLAELRSSGATVLVDFSADWCMTCKLNLATAIETDKVREAIEANRIVPLLADWTEESPEIKATLESLESKSIPVLAIFPAVPPGRDARGPIVLRDLITETQVLDAIRQAGPSVEGVAARRSAAAALPKGH